jgi:putative intracellular protease/amidase/predicted alpha/beta hydrolase family esterase
MRTLLVIITLLLAQVTGFGQHNAGNNGKILMIASNAAVSKQTGWPIGVWYAEIAHPYWVFSEAGYTVDIASPDGGEIKFDGFSDPEDPSKYAAFDYVSLGFKKDPAKSEQLKNTLKLSAVNPNDYKAIFVAGGQGPMYTFIDNGELHALFAKFYLTGKPTAAICHGTCILLKTKLPNGKYLVEGKRWTGFAASEEQYADNYVGQKIQPFRIEDEARKMPGSKFETGAPFSAYAVQDGNLITGQQQNSGAAAAELVVKALDKDRKRYPTYVLVHGAWADESSWGFVRNELARKANVVVVNLPAHGIDLRSPSVVTMKDYVQTVITAIQAQPGKVRLVGHSMAGMVISQVAEAIPAKIEKLIYVSAYLPANGDDILSLSKKDSETQVGAALEFDEQFTSARIKATVIPAAVCADCADFMKEALVKYHKAEPTKPLGEKASLTKLNFGTVPKYYITTSLDKAVGYTLQKQMIKANGNIIKVYDLPTSHLSFVVQPQQFISILREIN